MKRFLLFSGWDYYASGGWRDYVDSFDSVEEALKHHEQEKFEAHSWWHVIDATTGEQVYEETRCRS